MAKDVLPQMCEVSRYCGHTQHLHRIFQTKLSEEDFHTLKEWLRIVREERDMEVNRVKNNFTRKW